MATTCYGCARDLGQPKKKFEWLVSRGYDEKDAAAAVLHNPSSKIPIKQCCIVGLQTNLDSNKGVADREQTKVELEQEIARAIHEAGMQPDMREEVKVFSSDESGNVAGHFILRDADFEDPTLLAPTFEDRSRGIETKGFEITDIALVPPYTSDREGWGNKAPLALWSGNLKIIPVIPVGNSLLPGTIWVKSQAGDKPMTVIDKSFLGSEIMEYSIQNISLQQGLDVTTGQPIMVDAPLHVIRIKKLLPSEIIE